MTLDHVDDLRALLQTWRERAEASRKECRDTTLNEREHIAAIAAHLETVGCIQDLMRAMGLYGTYDTSDNVGYDPIVVPEPYYIGREIGYFAYWHPIVAGLGETAEQILSYTRATVGALRRMSKYDKPSEFLSLEKGGHLNMPMHGQLLEGDDLLLWWRGHLAGMKAAKRDYERSKRGKEWTHGNKK